MGIAIAACAFLLVATTVIHYEVLRLMTTALPALRIPPRMRLVFVIVGAFGAHFIEILLYGLAYYLLATRFGAHAIRAVADGAFGSMVALRGTDIVRVPISAATSELKLVPPERYAEAELFFG